MVSNAVEIRNLTKEFKPSFGAKKVVAAKDISLSIRAGEIYGLIGPNGSGKSTTMKALLGLLAPSAGTCHIFGKNSLKVDSREEVGYLPENPYFYKHLTGEETLSFYGKLCGIRGKRLKQRIDELLETVDLVDARKRRIGTYSKGMLQRIGLAQALIHEPRLLILDEPTAGVDPTGSREIRDLILSLKSQGITIFLCSHLLEQVQEICDKIGIIFNGEMVMEGNLNQLISVENKTELTLEGDESEILEKLSQLDDIKIIQSGTPKKSLESLFIEITERRKSS